MYMHWSKIQKKSLHTCICIYVFTFCIFCAPRKENRYKVQLYFTYFLFWNNDLSTELFLNCYVFKDIINSDKVNRPNQKYFLRLDFNSIILYYYKIYCVHSFSKINWFFIWLEIYLVSTFKCMWKSKWSEEITSMQKFSYVKFFR